MLAAQATVKLRGEDKINITTLFYNLNKSKIYFYSMCLLLFVLIMSKYLLYPVFIEFGISHYKLNLVLSEAMEENNVIII